MKIDASRLVFPYKPAREHLGNRLSLRRSKPDGTELKFGQVLKLNAYRSVPDPGGVIDFSKQIRLVKDQGQKGSCYSFTGTGLKSYHEITQGDYPDGGFSEAHIVSHCKALDGYPNQEGSDFKTLMKVLQTFGVCLEKTLPYSELEKLPGAQVPKITAAMDKEALPYRIQNYAQILAATDGNRDMAEYLFRQALLTQGPFPIGVYVFESFAPDAQGIIPVPGTTLERDTYRGNHAIFAVGHYPGIGPKLQNSWGKEWGLGGFAFLANDWLKAYWAPAGVGEKAWFLSEAWTAVDLGGGKVPKPDVVKSTRADLIVFTLDSDTMYVDGRSVRLEQPAESDPDTDRSLAPIAKFAEAAGYSVQWIEKDRQIILRNRG